jgi:hypothetical protein
MHKGVELLRVAFIAGAVVDAGAAVGMVFPNRFGGSLRYLAPFDPDRVELRYGMRYGAPLMAGWTVLLLWGLADPVERRSLLLITVVPVVLGLMLNDTVAHGQGLLRSGPLWATRILQIGLIALFVTAYVSSG